MCLAKVWTNEEMNEWLEGQGEVIEVWKVTTVLNNESYGNYYRGCSYTCAYLGGLDVARPEWMLEKKSFRYWPNFHFFEKAPPRTHTTYLMASNHPVQFIKCLIKKEWVTAVGEEEGAIVIVASQAVFPHFPDTEARYEDIPQEQTAKAVV